MKKATQWITILAALLVIISGMDQVHKRQEWNELEKERLRLSIELLKTQLKNK